MDVVQLKFVTVAPPEADSPVGADGGVVSAEALVVALEVLE